MNLGRRQGHAPVTTDARAQVIDLSQAPMAAGWPPGLTVTGSFGAQARLVWSSSDAAQGSVTLQVRGGVPAAGVDLRIVRPLAGKLLVTLKGRSLRLDLGDSRMFSGMINLLDDSAVVIGADVTCQEARISCRSGSVAIGRDCMLSAGISIEAGQYHGLVDISGSQPQLLDRRSEVVIGDHVWLGTNAMVLDQCKIGSGTVVGAGAVAAGDYPANSVIVGNPARVVRNDTTWSRQAGEIHRSTHDYLAAYRAASRVPAPARSHEGEV